MAEKKRVTMALGDQVTVEVEMCQDPECALAAGHPPGKHRERRMSMLACPHNVPNFGPECPICDVASVQLGGKVRYELYGDPRLRDFGNTHYAVAYDRITGKDKLSTAHLGDFRDIMDTASLVAQLKDEGKQNIRVQSRLISDYVDIGERHG